MMKKFSQKKESKEEVTISKKDKNRRTVGVIVCSVLSAVAVAMVNYISFSINNTRTNQLMLCALIGFLADILVVELSKAAIKFALLIYIGKSNAAGGKKRKCLLRLLPTSLMEKLR